MRNGRQLVRVAVALVVLGLPGTAAGKLRLMRILDWRSGLPVSYTGNVEQDPEGFLWVTTSGGLFRYDGSEMVRRFPVGVGLVHGAATAGTFLSYVDHDGEMELRERDGRPLLGPDGQVVRVPVAQVTRDGALWTLTARTVRRRGTDGAWSAPVTLPGGDTAHAGPSLGRGHSLLVPGRKAVYRVDAGGRVTTVANVRGALGSLDRPDGSTVIGTFVSGSGFVYEARGGTVHEIDRFPTRFMALTARGPALWIAYDSALVRLAPGDPRETITTRDGLPSGGAMLVDREGSLWVATFRGLVQFPEPDAVAWDVEVPGVGRHVVLHGGSVWMSTWGGMFRAHLTQVGWSLDREPHAHIGGPCFDRSGTLWTATLSGFAAVPPVGPARVHSAPGVLDADQCFASQGGDVWFPTLAGLFVLSPEDREPRRVLAPEAHPGLILQAYVDSKGTLWVASEDRICSAAAEEVKRGRDDAHWTCTPAVGRQVTDFLEQESGALWAGTFNAGVWRLRDGKWEEIPASRELPSRWATQLSRSPRGGVWVGGEGNFLRVRERTDLPGGWEVLERIGSWQGLPTSGIQDVAEAEDGTLWAATNLSLVRIPAAARETQPQPPPVVLVDAAVDGRALTIPTDRALRLPHSRNRLELRFAALSYRDPSLIRYRSRLNPQDTWSAPTRQPFFRFVDLRPGRYQIAVEASLDGTRWSPARQAVVFDVLPPWYGTWWFRGLVVSLLAAVLVLAYRLRVASLLKLERQRMRIAMDLHDEVGSGLGSIGVLAGILARPDLPDGHRADLTGRITGVARELSHSLGDIVWSLRSGSASLDALWSKILDRARPLFAAGTPQLRVVAPDPVPPTPLSLVVRRNVSLMAIEALHNAARHAAASAVDLSLRAEDGAWVLTVTDDGQGLQAASGDSTRRGLGLEGMRLRAEEMGGSVVFETPDRGGTSVVIRFREGRD